jgi:hypothetical protein
MTKRIIYLFSALLLYSLSFSQTIKGNVNSETNEPLSANVLIKNSENKDLISEFFKTEDDGSFNAVLEKKYNKIYFEVTAMGYEKIADSIINPEKEKIYSFNFAMKSKANELEEVVIKEEKFEVEGDTVSFNPKSFKDGTERKVEDLIKKLPGMEVQSNGSIKYKGKNVTSVQIEGDDLFGYNYTLGTRNISVDMVEQVQAIDNYSANALLKGIENSENVAINLKIKKGKVDFSGNGLFGSGFDSNIEPRNDINFNLLGIAKRFKSFGNISYNNMGSINSTEDYSSINTSLNDYFNSDFYAKRAVSENSFPSNIDYQRTAINNQLGATYNIIYRFSSKFSIKTNLSFMKDKIYALETNNNFFNAQNITYNDQTETIKKPENRKIEIKLN